MASWVTVTKLNPPFMCNWRLHVTFCWQTNLAVEHETHSKAFNLTGEKLDGITGAELKLLIYIHSRKNFCGLKVTSPFGKQTLNDTYLWRGILAPSSLKTENKAPSALFCGYANFYQSNEKITQIRTCDTQQFITVSLGRINTKYTALCKIIN